MAISFCTLGSGSKGNSYLVAGERNKILIDAGFSAKYLSCSLNGIGVNPAEIDGIIVTHEHSDHVSAIKVFSKTYNVPIYANEPTAEAYMRKNGELHDIRIINNFEDFFIGEFDIAPFKTPHDSASSCGYSVYSKSNKITVATDIGHMTKTVLEACKDSDLLVLEANHDLEMLKNGPYPQVLKNRVAGANGHLSNTVCGQTLAYLLDYGLHHAVLAHLSEENNTPELAYSTVCDFLAQRGAKIDEDIKIEVAEQHTTGKIYRIG